MKKIVSLLFLFSFVLIPSVPVYAQGSSYARVISDNVMFYRAADDPLFLLPKGYYVTVLGESGLYYEVEYAGSSGEFTALQGFVLKSDLTPVSEVPASPMFPSVTVTVTSSYTFIFSSVTGEASETSLNSGFTLSYYGVRKSPDNTVYYFVKYRSYLGYVPAAAVSQPIVPAHPTPLPRPPEPELPETGGETEPPVDISKWVLILGISIPALIIVILLFRPQKNNRAKAKVPSFLEEFDELDDM